jgi:glycosyltransferase involved in cell wall biosynthesis
MALSASKISIVLATYDGEKFLRPLMDSLLAQEYPDFEIVASDDCSKDSTPSILGEYARRAPDRVKVIRGERNLGYVGNFERGIRASSGEFLALCDQDDVWLPGKLGELAALLAGGSPLAFSDLEIVDEELRPLGYGMWRTLGLHRRDLAGLRGDRAFEFLLRRNLVNGCGLLARRDIVLACLPFPCLEYFVHDQWIALTAAFFGPILPCPLRLVLYRQHSSQQTGGTKSPVAATLSAKESARDYKSYAAGWALLFERLAAMGADADKIAWAKAWVERRTSALRRREEDLGLRTILSFLFRGTYFTQFSGLKSLAKDALFLARRRSRIRG